MAETFNFLSYKRKKKEEEKSYRSFKNLLFGNLINNFSPDLFFELIVEEITLVKSTNIT